ncbi:MAG: TolC family protein [Woeseiaceae bacterium]
MKNFNPWQFTAWVSVFVAMAFTQTAMATQTNESNTLVSSELITLVKQHLANHPELRALKADLQASKAGVRAADQAIYNPQLEFDYEDAEVETKTIGISQTIDWGGQRNSRTLVADAQLRKQQADYQLSVQMFINTLLAGLAEHQTGTELVGLGQQTMKLMQDFKQIAEQRYAAGDLNLVEFNLAKLAYSQAVMEQASVLSNATQARENLRSLLGDLPNKLPELPERLPTPEIKQDLDSFLQQLPIVRVQLADLDVARQTVDLKKSEKAWDPTISLTAGTEGDADLIGLNLSIPLNIRNTFGAEVDAAQQQLIASEQRAHLAFRTQRAALISNTERYKNLLNAWNNWRENSRDSVNQQLKLIKQLWEAGDISASDYLLQLKQALETQASGLELRNQLWLVAFDWMSQTNTLDNWLNIKQPTQNK